MSSVLVYNEGKEKWNIEASGDKHMAVISKNKCSIGVQVDKKTIKMMKAFLNKSSDTKKVLSLPDFMSSSCKTTAKYALRFSKKTMEPYLRDVDHRETKSSVALVTLNTNFKSIVNIDLKNTKILEFSLPKKHSKEKFIDLIVYIDKDSRPEESSYIKVTLFNSKTNELEYVTLDQTAVVKSTEKTNKDREELGSFKFKKMRPYNLTELLVVDAGYEKLIYNWLNKNKRRDKHIVMVLPSDKEKQDEVIQEMINKGYRASTYIIAGKENKRKNYAVVTKLSKSFRFVFISKCKDSKNKSVRRFK